MDHADAHLIEFTRDTNDVVHVSSKFTHQQKEHSLGKSEKLMHNKENHQQSSYYNELGDSIRKYQEVLLFGPTHAKTELFNVLRKDHNFDKIVIEIQQTDKMTEGQQHTFVKEHFEKF